MVDGAVCGTQQKDWCEHCPEYEEERSAHIALCEDIGEVVNDLELSMKYQSWASVANVLHKMKELI